MKPVSIDDEVGSRLENRGVRSLSIKQCSRLLESALEQECLKTNRSSYCIIHAEGRPGNFYLVYKHVNTRVKRDGILVTPSHFEFRGQTLVPPLARVFDTWKKDEMRKSMW